jgi:two-component system nitrate/nitrite response regulator NarL
MTDSKDAQPIINIFIADRTSLGCELMKTALEQSGYRLSVVGCYTESVLLNSERRNKCSVHIDVALISATLSDGPLGGFNLMREMRFSNPNTGIVALLDSKERVVIVEAFRSGARGLLFKEQSFETVCKCIHAVYQGQVWANSEEMRFALDALVQVEATSKKGKQDRAGLTAREEAIVQLVAEGFTNRDISERLSLSLNTVRNYMFRIFNKVGTSNRLELALYVLNRKTNGAIDPTKVPIHGRR